MAKQKKDKEVRAAEVSSTGFEPLWYKTMHCPPLLWKVVLYVVNLQKLKRFRAFQIWDDNFLRHFLHHLHANLNTLRKTGSVRLHKEDGSDVISLTLQTRALSKTWCWGKRTATRQRGIVSASNTETLLLREVEDLAWDHRLTWGEVFITWPGLGWTQ